MLITRGVIQKQLHLSTKWEIVVKSGINFPIFDLDSAKQLFPVINFIGTYECKTDAKGRFMMPAALKKQLTPVMQEGFVIKRAVFQPCLELYPLVEWNKMMEKLNGLNRFNRKHNDFIRRFTAGVKTVEVDANGRLLIPKDLITIAGITKEVTVSSAVNILEIWDKERYEAAIDNSLDDFADLAEEVMANDTTDLLP